MTPGLILNILTKSWTAKSFSEGLWRLSMTAVLLPHDFANN
jgi:hypothetical protein